MDLSHAYPYFGNANCLPFRMRHHFGFACDIGKSWSEDCARTGRLPYHHVRDYYEANPCKRRYKSIMRTQPDQ